MRKLWQWLLDALEALADDDRNVAQKTRDHVDAQKRFLTFLGSGNSR